MRPPVIPPGPSPRVTACDREARDLLAAWRAAFAPGHPHHFPGSDEQALHEQLAPLLAGTMLGPLLPCGRLAVDPDDRVVAGVVVADRQGLPWIATVFRRPGRGHAGLGSLLVRRTLAAAAADGLAEVGLAVSEDNPARRLYESLGFSVTVTSLTVIVP
ncbi:GNAT family N-acetyltransferase [Streptomyces sp. ODS05-4]|uniref:GNAT family N-acetyltransferase n=1 Tax=Streptomyces sp. ODS05-4 TaxID=2944939 RepID=UPI00210A68C1|nr:GNAT family N-acetyltransferase [Streptomyces sp. ODS05-4]